MTRLVRSALMAVVLLAGIPAAAHADLTAFAGSTMTPKARAARGAAFGVSLIVIGFEFEYASTIEDPANASPALRTWMLNGLVQTPTRTQLYLTLGGGLFRERLGTAGETSFGTNVGGGVKFSLVGPLRLRLDYRVFNLRGSPLYATPQRIYAGVNLTF